VQGVNTDQVLGTIIAELEQQDDLKVAFHLEPYEGEPMCCTAPGPGGGPGTGLHVLLQYLLLLLLLLLLFPCGPLP